MLPSGVAFKGSAPARVWRGGCGWGAGEIYDSLQRSFAFSTFKSPLSTDVFEAKRFEKPANKRLSTSLSLGRAEGA
jgi:hypothetical protein